MDVDKSDLFRNCKFYLRFDIYHILKYLQKTVDVDKSDLFRNFLEYRKLRDIDLTHYGLMTHRYVSEMDHHLSRSKLISNHCFRFGALLNKHANDLSTEVLPDVICEVMTFEKINSELINPLNFNTFN